MKKITRLMFLLILLIVNTSCYNKHSAIFNEGLFKYEGDPLLFYKGMINDEETEFYIEEITLDVREISLEQYKISKVNVIKNMSNKNCYKMILMMKFNNTEPIIYNFESGYNPDIPDTYFLFPKVKDIYGDDLTLALEFRVMNNKYIPDDKKYGVIFGETYFYSEKKYHIEDIPTMLLLYQNDNEHQYIIDYKSFSNTHHQSFCECGLYKLEPHVYMNEGVTNKTSSCIKCGHNKEQLKEEVIRNLITNTI